MPTSIELRQQRARILESMRSRLATAEAAGRDSLTATEATAHRADSDRFQDLTVQIDEAEAAEARELAGARPIPHPDDPEGRSTYGDPSRHHDGVRTSGNVRILGRDDRVADLYGREDGSYGALGTLAKSLVGTVSEREVARFLPQAGRDMLSSGGAGVLVPTPVSAQVIDLLRARTVVNRLGARTVPMDSATLTIPRVLADPTATWGTEGSAYAVGDGDMDGVTFTPQRLGALVRLSDELDEDSDPDLAGEVLANSLAQAFAVELDRVALRGSGVAPEPTGVRNMSGTTIVAAVGGADWTTLSGFARDLALANSQASGFVLSPRTEDALATATDTTGQYIAPPSTIRGIDRLTTTAVPIDLGAGTNESEIYAGNWQHLMIGMRVSFELRRLEERYADEGKVALRARLRADVQTSHGASFIVGTGVTN